MSARWLRLSWAAAAAASSVITSPSCDNVAELPVIDPALSATTAVAFGTVVVGQSRDTVVTLTNGPNSAADLSGTIDISGNAFSIVSGGGAYSLGAGQARTIAVRFAPATATALNGALSIAHNGTTAESPFSVPLTGTGGTIMPDATPDSVAFGTVVVGQSRDTVITLTNGTNSAAALSGTIDISGNAFSIVSGGGAYSLAAGQAQAITVRFAPPTATAVTGALSITHNGTTAASPLSVPLTGTGGGYLPAVVVTIGTDAHHTCALTPAGAAWCWGANEGQLGDSSLTPRSVPVRVAGGLAFAALAPGWNHTCARTAANTAYCWGANADGQLGNGTTAPATFPTLVPGTLAFSALAAGVGVTCGLVDTAAWCWGNNLYGQLGDGSTESRSLPVSVSGGLAFTSVATSGYHTCALVGSGAAYCWGYNRLGQLGDGTNVFSSTPVPVYGGLVFVAIVAGDEHTCALTAEGIAYCWGDNTFGQLGCLWSGCGFAANTPQAVVDNVRYTLLAAGDWHTCGLDGTGKAFCWGDNSYGQLGQSPAGGLSTSPYPVDGARIFMTLAAGGEHTCGVTGGALYCWGWNYSGQLGRGTFGGYSPVPAPVAPVMLLK